jgi:acyl carrier protein
MTISSRTPEGEPHRCPVCDASVRIEPSLPSGDAPCPNCGILLWFVADDERLRLYDATAMKAVASRIADEHPFLEELGADSLDTAELVMELEEELGIVIADEAERLATVADVIKYMLEHPDVPPHDPPPE